MTMTPDLWTPSDELLGLDPIALQKIQAPFRRPPRKGDVLKRRQAGQPAHVIAISWQAQQRLHRTWQRLDHERGKRRTVVAVAVARELAGFCWAAANAD